MLKQTKLKQQYDRTVISVKGEYGTKSVVNYAEKLYNKNSKIENLQGFVDDETIRKHIRNNKILKLNIGKQEKHIEGTNNYNQEIKNNRNPSKIVSNNDEIEKIIQQYAGTGRIIRKPDGSFNDKEFVIIKELLGIDVDDDTKIETETHNFIIHYAKDGTHIVPTK